MRKHLEIILLASKTLKKNLLRSSLTILGISIGVFSVIMIVGLVSGLKQDIRAQILAIGADVLDVIPGKSSDYGPGSSLIFSTFKNSEIDAVKRGMKNYYKEFSVLYQISGTYSRGDNKKNAFLLGVESSYFDIIDTKISIGRLFDISDDRNRKKVTVIGHKLATDLYSTPSNALGKDIDINGKSFEIIGVSEKNNLNMGRFDINEIAYIPAASAESYFENSSPTDMYIQLKNEKDTDIAKLEITKILNKIKGKDEFSVLAQDDLLEVVESVTSLISTALAGLASISLLVGGIGIMNIMVVTVTERTREIGIRKALGAKNFDIMLQFLSEAVGLSVIGGFVGLFLAIAVSRVLSEIYGVSSFISTLTIFGSVIFSVIVGIVFGTIPAYKASKKDPIESLRYE